jgi:hypothetical protein
VRSARTATALLLLAGLALSGAPAAHAAGKLPKHWPRTLQLGAWSPFGDGKKLRRTAPFGLRYQYLGGGVNTGNSWRYVAPNGSFVKLYVKESVRYRMTPVFTYSMLRESLPGGRIENIPAAVKANLENRGTMRAYFKDLKFFFKRAAATRKRIVLHVEPNIWGYAEQRAIAKDDASSVPVVVSATGLRELRGLPNNVTGLAKAVRRLRDRYARRVLLAYHLTTWGPDVDLDQDNPPREPVEAFARTAARYYRSLHTRFDLVFAEFANRDAAYRQLVFGETGTYWDAADYARYLRFIRVFNRNTRRRIVLWRIPLGNTLFRSVNNTSGHYQDNRVQWFLGPKGVRQLRFYRSAGVAAFIFGGGAPGTTCACDFRHDGVTNPPPINGNTRRTRSRDDDGGYFRSRARAYYRRGALRIRR